MAHVAMAIRRVVVSRRSRVLAASGARGNTIYVWSTADTQFSVVHRDVTAGSVIVRLSNRASADVLAQEGDVVLSALVGGFADHRGACGLDDRDEQLGVDLSGAEVGVPVGARACGVSRVVAVHQVDAAGEGLDAIDRVDQRLTSGPGMAGVEAEPDAAVADVVPQPADDVEVTGHRMVAARGVL